jgi:hypothetical protein
MSVSIEETLIRCVLGLLSFIFLIAWLRWEGPLEVQKNGERQSRNELTDKRSNKYAEELEILQGPPKQRPP